MTHLSSTLIRPTAPEAVEAAEAVAVRFPVAYVLWGVVGAALVYGIAMTVLKASALFTS